MESVCAGISVVSAKNFTALNASKTAKTAKDKNPNLRD